MPATSVSPGVSEKENWERSLKTLPSGKQLVHRKKAGIGVREPGLKSPSVTVGRLLN